MPHSSPITDNLYPSYLGLHRLAQDAVAAPPQNGIRDLAAETFGFLRGQTPLFADDFLALQVRDHSPEQEILVLERGMAPNGDLTSALQTL